MRGTFDNEIRSAITQAKSVNGGAGGAKPFAKSSKGNKSLGKFVTSKKTPGAPVDNDAEDLIDGGSDDAIENMSKPAVTPKQAMGLKKAGGFNKNGPAELSKNLPSNRRAGVR
jgi:hypothetical protein